MQRIGNTMAENLGLRIALDVSCTALAGFCVLLFYLFGKPYRRGFYCDDASIRYPYIDSTVTNVELYVLGIGVPIIIMLITEAIHIIVRRSRTRGRITVKNYVLCGNEIHPYISKCYTTIGIFLFGACLAQLTTDIAKYAVGRLRPHFLAICKPNINCSEAQYKFMFVEKYHCTGDDDFRIRESRLSFLSGHASFSSYAMVYLALYLQARMTCRYFTLVKPLIQALFMMVAWFTALSRVSDYKHHPTDVLAGCILGTVVAVVVVFILSDLFRKKSSALTPVPLQHSPEDQVGTQLDKYNPDVEENRQTS